MADRVKTGNANFAAMRRNSNVVNHATNYPAMGGLNKVGSGGNPAVKAPLASSGAKIAGKGAAKPC